LHQLSVSCTSRAIELRPGSNGKNVFSVCRVIKCHKRRPRPSRRFVAAGVRPRPFCASLAYTHVIPNCRRTNPPSRTSTPGPTPERFRLEHRRSARQTARKKNIAAPPKSPDKIEGGGTGGRRHVLGVQMRPESEMCDCHGPATLQARFRLSPPVFMRFRRQASDWGAPYTKHQGPMPRRSVHARGTPSDQHLNSRRAQHNIAAFRAPLSLPRMESLPPLADEPLPSGAM